MDIKKISIIASFLLSFLTVANGAELLVVTTESRSFQYQEDGLNKGPSIDILTKILKESGLNADIKFLPWARTYQTVLTRPNTLVLGMIRTKEREDKFYWIQVLARVERAFIALKNKPQNHVENIQQAMAKRIAVLRESYAHNTLLNKGFIEGQNLYVVSTLDNMFNLFINGKVDLVFADPNVVKYYSIKYKQKIAVTYQNNIEKVGYLAANIDTNPQYIKKLQAAVLKLNIIK